MWSCGSQSTQLKQRSECRIECGVFFSPCPSLVALFHRTTRGLITYFLEARSALPGASVFEGELRDGGFVQITFPECNEFLILIVGRLSQRDGDLGGFR